MKDIEKIQSTDVVAQVLDTNPANYDVEQEVAELVGVTLPDPSDPTADDARELSATLGVFLNRALTPIIDALHTCMSDLYVHLDGRCTAYTPAAYAPFVLRPYDPQHASYPRTLANLLPNMSAFDSRKISNGSATNDGIVDGVSFAHLLCSTDTANAVTEIKDDNDPWVGASVAQLISLFPNMKKLTANCKSSTTAVVVGHSKLEYVDMAYLTSCGGTQFMYNNAKLKTIKIDNFPGLGLWYDRYAFSNMPELEEIYAPSYNGMENANGYMVFRGLQSLERCILGKIEKWSYRSESRNEGFFADSTKLIKLSIGAGTAINLDIFGWKPSYVLSDNPTGTDLIEEGSTAQNNLQQFLVNFRRHLITRLAPMTSSTTKTLTLSAAVYQTVYGLDANDEVDPTSAAQTLSLADLGVTSEDLNEIEIATGITTSTKYASWLSTYRAAIYWNITK